MRIEICTSCLKAQGLLESGEDRDAWLARLRQDLGKPWPELRLGQCQRLCPAGKVTLGLGNGDGEPMRLGLAPAGSRGEFLKALERLALSNLGTRC